MDAINLSLRPLPRLKEAEEARSLCVSIETLECSGELVKSLTDHATAMTNLFRELNKLTSEGHDDESVYKPFFEKAVQYQAWYVKRKKVAQSMKNAATKWAASGNAGWSSEIIQLSVLVGIINICFQLFPFCTMIETSNQWRLMALQRLAQVVFEPVFAV